MRLSATNFLFSVSLLPGAKVVCWRPHLAGTRQHVRVSVLETLLLNLMFFKSIIFNRNISFLCFDLYQGSHHVYNAMKY